MEKVDTCDRHETLNFYNNKQSNESQLKQSATCKH